MENLESHGILEFDFPGLESHGKSWKTFSSLDLAVAFSVNENRKKRKLMSHKLDPLHLFL